MNMDSNKPAEKAEQKTWLDVLIKRMDRCIKGTAVVTVLLGVIYAFALRTMAVKVAFLAAFFISIDLAAVGALLVAFREVKQRGSIGSIVFFGSFGIVVLVVSAFIVVSLIPR